MANLLQKELKTVNKQIKKRNARIRRDKSDIKRFKGRIRKEDAIVITGLGIISRGKIKLCFFE